MMAWIGRAVGMLGLLVIAVISAAINWSAAVASSDPATALSLFPGQTTALFARAETLRLASDIPQDLQETSQALLRRAPLLDAPLVYAGLKLAADGDKAGARSAFLAATKRQPRNLPALSWLTLDAIEQGQFDLAADRLERLSLLNPEDMRVYANIFAAMAADEAGLAAVESRLTGSSPLARATLDRLNVTSKSLPLLLRLNANSPSGQKQLVARVFSEQGAIPAFIAWLSLAPDMEATTLSWPVDPVFVGNDAPLPFNWEVAEGSELLPQGGLYVSYSGRDRPTFARQLMLLSPGRYALRAEMDGEASPTGAMFEWSLQCYPSGAEAGALVIAELSLTLSAHDLEFEVPTDDACAAQYLVLRGKPGDFPTRARASVRRLTIQAAGAGE